MTLTINTFKHIIKIIRAAYGMNWRPELDTDEATLLVFFDSCRRAIPEEMAIEMVTVYYSRRARAPYSAYDILEANIEKQLEEAKSCEFVIERLTTAIRDYEYHDGYSQFADRDDFLFNNVISTLPCPTGIKAFYIRNKKTLEDLALHSPDQFEQASMYNRLGKDYDKQLTITERNAIVNKTNYKALSEGKKQPDNRLEA